MEQIDSRNRFSASRVVVPALVLLLVVSLYANWYSQRVSLPRYCEDTTQTLRDLRTLLSDDRPAGERPRRPYLIAAKLLFLIPRRGDEPVDDYVERVERYLHSTCR